MRPEYKKHVFKANTETNYFDKVSAPIGFIKLPNELKLEKPIREDYLNKGVKFFLKSRMVKGVYSFQTGLISTGIENWFFGDHFHPKENKKNSFCLFQFDPTATELTVYYFNHFNLFPKKRDLFVKQFIKSIGVCEFLIGQNGND